MTKLLIFIACLLHSGLIFSQKSNKILKFDYQLAVDNDVFTFNLQRDQYYSSGIYPAFRHLVDSMNNLKVIRSYQLNHRMYTPKWIGWELQEELDRPYAGQISASIRQEYYAPNNQYLSVQFELGIMGPGALLGETQETWHRWFGMPIPKGWQYQINNTPIINLYTTYARALYSSYQFEISAETNVAVGSVYNFGRQEIMFRTGQLKPLHQSAYYGSLLGNPRKAKVSGSSAVETYLFYAPGIEWVWYNATLEGNLIGEPSIYTVDANNLIIQHKAGFMLSWPRFDLSYVIYWRSPENATATKHSFATIRMNQRF